MPIKNYQLKTDNYLIVGLGNPGKKYKHTRHNVGCWIIDQLKDSDILRPGTGLIKTGVFMNSSGEEVKKLVDKGHISLNNLIVVHDDLDLPSGEFRLQKGRGAAGHRGVISIIQALGSEDFWRLRVGIGRPGEGVDAEEYVLGEFSGNETEMLVNLLPTLSNKLCKMQNEE